MFQRNGLWVVGVALCLMNLAQAQHLFTLVGDGPILQAGEGGSWSSPAQNSGAVLFHKEQFHMFRNGFTRLPGPVQMGYSSSPDGVTWTHFEDNPIFGTSDVPYGGVMVMVSSVHVEEGTWVMYFYTWETRTLPMGGGAIGRATALAPNRSLDSRRITCAGGWT